MTTINFGTAISLADAAALIIACPRIRFFLRGEPGIGKSSLMGALEEKLGDDYAYAYFDCAQKDLGDIAMPSPNRDRRVTEYFPNAALQLQSGKPVVIMLDEFSKAPQPVQNMLHPLLEARNPRLGDVPLPEGSIIFLTGNYSGDNVGDNLKAHTMSRVTAVNVRKPNADEWLSWAVRNNRSEVVMAWVKEYPHALASYLDDGQAENPYIYNPRKPLASYVCPRSLDLVSEIVNARDTLPAEAVLAAMRGTIGEAAARDMEAFVNYQDQLEPWERIVNNPSTARIPDSPGACSVMIFGAIRKVTKDTFEAFMQYLGRMDAEWQAAFAINVAKNPEKQALAFSSPAFTGWLRDNQDLL